MPNYTPYLVLLQIDFDDIFEYFPTTDTRIMDAFRARIASQFPWSFEVIENTYALGAQGSGNKVASTIYECFASARSEIIPPETAPEVMVFDGQRIPRERDICIKELIVCAIGDHFADLSQPDSARYFDAIVQRARCGHECNLRQPLANFSEIAPIEHRQ